MKKVFLLMAIAWGLMAGQVRANIDPIKILIMTPYMADVPKLKETFGAGNGKVVIGFSSGFEYLSSLDHTNPNNDHQVYLDYLEKMITASLQSNLPMMVHLNGHRWTVADYLSQIDKTMMYNQNGIPLTKLPEWNDRSYGLIANKIPAQQVGSLLFSLNEYNDLYRAYKKRNIQQSAERLAKFYKEHPDLFAGVSLDSEISFCPGGLPGWTNYSYSFDYNPMTIVQWRHWLSGNTGSYVNSNYVNYYATGGKLFGQGKNLTLDQLKNRYGTNYQSWDYVEPPRQMSLGTDGKIIDNIDNKNLIDDWLEFKATLTNNILADMVKWVEEMGIPRSMIYSHQPGTVIEYQDLNRYCGIPYQSANVSGAGVGVDLYGTYTYLPDFFSSVNSLNKNWGAPEWNATSDAEHRTKEYVVKSLQTAYDNGADFLVPNYFTSNTSFPGDYLQLINNQFFIDGLKEFMANNSSLQGDVNSDGKIDLVDFSFWKIEYVNNRNGKADLNKDGKTDLVDFAIWKKEYLK